MGRRHAKLTAGHGWTDMLAGTPARSLLIDQYGGASGLARAMVRELERLHQMHTDQEREAAVAALPDAMELLRSTSNLRDHDRYREGMRVIVEWLASSSPLPPGYRSRPPEGSTRG